jgi:hypothetical protein
MMHKMLREPVCTILFRFVKLIEDAAHYFCLKQTVYSCEMKIIENKTNIESLKAIVQIGLLTGTLDALGATIWNYQTPPATIFKFIASGVFGKQAFSGGTDMVLWGLFFHYLIAFSFTAAFYAMYPSFVRALKNKYVTGIVFAMVTWLITNLAVVPLSRIGWRPMEVDSILTGFVILIFTIGLPIALIADNLYSADNLQSA